MDTVKRWCDGANLTDSIVDRHRRARSAWPWTHQKAVSIASRQLAAPGAVMIRPLLLKPQWMNGLSERFLETITNTTIAARSGD